MGSKSIFDIFFIFFVITANREPRLANSSTAAPLGWNSRSDFHILKRPKTLNLICGSCWAGKSLLFHNLNVHLDMLYKLVKYIIYRWLYIKRYQLENLICLFLYPKYFLTSLSSYENVSWTTCYGTTTINWITYSTNLHHFSKHTWRPTGQTVLYCNSVK